MGQAGHRAWAGAGLFLEAGELVAHADERLAVALALVGGKGEDAGEVVALLALLLLAEVPHHVRAALVALAEDVEEEEVDVVVERLVVEEELGEEAEVLAKDLFAVAVNLKHGDVAVAVDLVARRPPQLGLGHVVQELLAALEEFERKLAHIQLLHSTWRRCCCLAKRASKLCIGPAEWREGARALQALNSSGKGEKYHVSMSYRPSSMRSMFFTFVNSSCSRISAMSKLPCSLPWSSSYLRFWTRLHAAAPSVKPSTPRLHARVPAPRPPNGGQIRALLAVGVHKRRL